MNEQFRPLSNIEYTITFNFDSHTPVKTGQYGDFVSYGVNHEGQLKYLTTGVKTALYTALKAMEPLKGKEITLERKELDGNKKVYYINGKPCEYQTNPAPGETAPVKQNNNEVLAAIGDLKLKVEEICQMLKVKELPF